MTLQENSIAPDFSVKDAHGNVIRLSQFRGKRVVLYFYPKDMTPGCTVEACEFNANLDAFKIRNTVVLGVSSDDEQRHQKFSKKYNLSFPLLADIDLSVSKAYGIYEKKFFMIKSFMGIKRTTFIIDKKGIIRKIFTKVKPKGHTKEVLQALDTLRI